MTASFLLLYKKVEYIGYYTEINSTTRRHGCHCHAVTPATRQPVPCWLAGSARHTTAKTIAKQWGTLVGDVPGATAIPDRFPHHADIIRITGAAAQNAVDNATN